ncbi:MAG TPA: FtsX-like permease family protein [Phycisphaerales bacterium]|nr:FtsX-like permease family protein [Phycisphaerales bacterium]
MPLTDLTIIRRSLRSRLFSTVATIATVAVAVALLLVLLSLRDSWRRAFDRGTGNMHILVSRDASPLVALLNGVFYANPPQRPIEWPKYQQIAGSFPFEFAIPVQYGDSFRGQPVLATTPEFFEKFQPVPGRPFRLAEGRFLAPEFDDEFEVVVGSAAAAARGLSLGDELVLSHGASTESGGLHEHDEFNFTVVGILEPTGSAHDQALFTHLESSWILHAMDRLERENPGEHIHVYSEDLTDQDRLITGIYLAVPTRPGAASSASLQPVFDALRRDPSITVAQPGQQIGVLRRVVGNIEQVLLAMAVVVLVSSSVSIMVALAGSIQQRRRQIAVLRVLGLSRPRVLWLVLTESAVLGALGALAGIAIAVVGSRLAASILKARVGLLVEPILDPLWLLLVLVGTVVLAALAGLAPALMAYRTSVASHLRPLG